MVNKCIFRKVLSDEHEHVYLVVRRCKIDKLKQEAFVRHLPWRERDMKYRTDAAMMEQ